MRALAYIPLIGLLASCSSMIEMGDPNVPEGSMRVIVPLGDRLRDAQVIGGQTSDITFTYQLPSRTPELSSVVVDLRATLDVTRVEVNRGELRRGLRGAQSELPIARAWAMIAGFNEETVVCEIGKSHGPIEITGDLQGQPVAVSPEDFEAPPETVAFINEERAFSVCLRVESPISANVRLDELVIVTRTASTSTTAL